MAWPNGVRHHEEDDQLADDDLIPLTLEEIHNSLSQRHGRFFHSHGPYPLPVDDVEGARLDGLHSIVKSLFDNRNYPRHLRNYFSRDGVGVIDIACGKGTWVEEMAAEFPLAMFYGVDTQSMFMDMGHNTDDSGEIGNIQFQEFDINSRFQFTDPFDVVHMRDVCLAVTNYQILIRQCASILNHGGLFLSGEWINTIYLANNDPLALVAPRLSQLLSRIEFSMASRGVNLRDNRYIADYLEESGQFTHIEKNTYRVPFDGPSEMKELVMEYAEAMRDLLLQSLTEAEVDELLERCQHELDTVPGLYAVFQVVVATRL